MLATAFRVKRVLYLYIEIGSLGDEVFIYIAAIKLSSLRKTVLIIVLMGYKTLFTQKNCVGGGFLSEESFISLYRNRLSR